MAILMVVILGAAAVFYLFALVQFGREMAAGRQSQYEHERPVPFCMACAQGWPHSVVADEEFRSTIETRARVLEMRRPEQSMIAKVRAHDKKSNRGAA